MTCYKIRSTACVVCKLSLTVSVPCGRGKLWRLTIYWERRSPGSVEAAGEYGVWDRNLTSVAFLVEGRNSLTTESWYLLLSNLLTALGVVRICEPRWHFLWCGQTLISRMDSRISVHPSWAAVWLDWTSRELRCSKLSLSLQGTSPNLMTWCCDLTIVISI
jgi:hypothetical protein